MEYKKKHKKISLALKKKVATRAVANKRKLEEKKPDDVCNSKKRKWTKPVSQTGHQPLTVREMFTYMKDEVNKSSDFKSCVKFVGRCEKLLETGQFDIEGNDRDTQWLLCFVAPWCSGYHNCTTSFNKA